jgi:ligand-binding sensor domain-containing protein/two-component sensor histidine kinase
MSRSLGRSWGLWLLLLVSIPTAQALDPHRALDHLGQQVWRTDSGLPQNTVHSLLQARNGYLWLGTDGGLVRFDGVEFVTFDTENTPSFKSDTVYDVSEDSSGRLWIATAAGLLAYQHGTFSRVQGLPSDVVWFTYEDQHHRLWAMTAGGPAWLDKDTFTPVAGAQGATPLDRGALAEDRSGQLWLGGSGGLWALDTSGTRPMVAAHLTPQPINAVAIDRDTVWAGGSQGLVRVHGRTLNPVAGGVDVTALTSDGTGGLWVGTPTGLLHQGATSPLGRSSFANPSRINRFFRDREGSLWIATEHGVFRQGQNSVEGFAASSPLSTSRTLTFLEDQEGDLWLGTDAGGLHLLREQKFSTFTTRDGLSGNFVRTVLPGPHGELWAGTDGEGLNRQSGTGFSPVPAQLSSNVILSLANAPGGDVWVGTPNGLNLLHENGPRKGQVDIFRTADGLPDDFIRSLYTDSDGSLWVGTRHGLAHRTGNTFTAFSSMDGLGSDLIGAILRDGPLWIGTAGGLSRLDQGRFSNQTVAEGLSNNTITAIARDTQGTLWLGTNGGGLNRLRDGKFFAFPTASPGLPGTLYGILEDSRGILWLSAKTGIFSVALADLDAFASGQTQALPVQSYGTADGMNIRESSGDGHPVTAKTPDGQLWFATLDGISVVDPEHMAINRVPPPVVMEQVLIDDQARPLSESLTLGPGAHRLEFRYAGLSFRAPQKVRYRYQLEGFDKDWVNAGNRRSAFYTNLSPGRYRFHVQAANGDGVWNTTGAAVPFRLKPHVYQTWWFYSGLVLALGGLGYLVYRWRVHAVEAQFAAVLRERSRIAREIHDTLAQGFVGISVQLEVVARMLKHSSDTSVQAQLDQVRAQARASLADARTSIWDLRSASSAQDLPSRFSRMATRLAGGSETKVYLQVKGTYRPLEAKMEEELLRIGQEAVANAIRHAQASRVDVELAYDAAHVRLRVTDDGCGFHAADNGLEGHYGLRGMRERAQEMAAVFSLHSSPGTGTRIEVEVLLKEKLSLVERKQAR